MLARIDRRGQGRQADDGGRPKAALAELQAQQKAAPTMKYQGNIELVVKHYDQLSADAGER